MSIYIIEEIGDDYHGSGIVSAHSDKVTAEAEKYRLTAEQEPCSECGHTYHYCITQLEVKD